MTPFSYPNQQLDRRHGPRGYSTAESYRPWLRDEFEFRCVYCLRRERWEAGLTNFEIDHWRARSRRPDLEFEYVNFVYACLTCNAAKRDLEVPDPTQVMVGVQVHADGRIVAASHQAIALIDKLGLNSPDTVRFRARWIRIIALAAERDPDLFRELMGYPDDLPDLGALRPPSGNLRPDGIVNSHHARRTRGELPATY